ncbi:Uncharacterized protein Adt_07315 [Abeliophyllum distichum]|uniref:Uncharacterized protein n=1 Tax=Abeliophyllum distichum TaxID=126358 RepID=A0ABD1V9E2_9LAMI
MKLYKNNFLLWKNMIMPIIKGHKLETKKCPPEFLESNGVLKLKQTVICSDESYGILNRSRVTFLTGKLQRTIKGSMSIDQYLTTAVQLADNLEIAGKSITHEDLVT